MHKIFLTLLLFLLTVLFFSACGSGAFEAPPAIQSSPDAAVTEETPLVVSSDMHRMDFETDYVPLPDYQAHKIKEIHTGLTDRNISAFTEAPGALYVFFWLDADNTGKTEHFIPAIRKYDSKGKLLWEKYYAIKSMQGASTCLAAYQDGFVLSIEKWPDYSAPTPEGKCYLMRCDGDGQILWQVESGSSTGEKIRKLFVTNQQEILTVGLLPSRFGAEGGASDIGITKWDAAGNVLAEQRYGGDDYETLLSAGYSDALGLVVSLQTQSYPALHHIIVCFDRDLKEKWSYKPEDSEIFSWENLLVTGNSVYQTGWLVSEGDRNKGFMVRLDDEGQVVFRDVGERRYQSLAALKDGNLAVSGVVGAVENQPGGAAMEQQDFLCVISPDHKVLHEEITRSDPSVSEIVPLSDGGFVTLSRRNIKTIPQPLYISSIWYDTEMVAARYDQHLRMIWRKTYNLHQDELMPDLVYVLNDAQLMVE